MSEEVEARRQELIGYIAETVRHLIKQDTLWNAGFFEHYDDEGVEYTDQAWNNDTVVAAMQRMMSDWIREHWGMELPLRDTSQGFAPHIQETLEGLDLLQAGGGRRE